MSNAGAIREKLACGGTLEVTAQSFQIHYYFPGPDRRYNGTTVYVPGNSIELYIDAFNANWKEYEKLKLIIPKGSEFEKAGCMLMSIRIGGFCEGVCIRSYHMPIRSLSRMREVIDAYYYAQKRAAQLQATLRQL